MNEKLLSDDTSKELMLRDNKTGRFIKRLDEEVSLSQNLIPQSFVQITNNVIHYTDTNLIISKIISERKEEKVEQIESTYNKIIDCLDNCRAYKGGIEKVFNHCENHSSEFDNLIRKLASDFDMDFSYNNQNETILYISKAYLKVLFCYILSAFHTHKHKVKNETVIYGKLQSFKEYLQDVLEKTLIPNDDYNQPLYRKSMYGMIIHNNNVNINYMDTLVKYDRRFNTALDIVRTHSNNVLRISQYNNWEFHGTYEEYNTEGEKVKYMKSLVSLLSDIDRLIEIRQEIDFIEDDEIFAQLEQQLNNF
ncbi:TPA: hypothetical protein ACN31N_000918 [Vibrio parahaemolyticus]